HGDRQARHVAAGLVRHHAQPLHRGSAREARIGPRKPAVAEIYYPPQRVIGFAAEDHRRMRLLEGLRIRPHGVEIYHLAVELGFLLSPERLHRENPLAQQLEARLVAGTVVLHLPDVPATADAEYEAAVRETVETRHRLGADDRIVLGHQADAGADLELFG